MTFVLYFIDHDPFTEEYFKIYANGKEVLKIKSENAITETSEWGKLCGGDYYDKRQIVTVTFDHKDSELDLAMSYSKGEFGGI